jgi:hypothetical protein
MQGVVPGKGVEPHGPTIAQVIPTIFMNAGTASRLRMLLNIEAKLAYVKQSDEVDRGGSGEAAQRGFGESQASQAGAI